MELNPVVQELTGINDSAFFQSAAIALWRSLPHPDLFGNQRSGGSSAAKGPPGVLPELIDGCGVPGGDRLAIVIDEYY